MTSDFRVGIWGSKMTPNIGRHRLKNVGQGRRGVQKWPKNVGRHLWTFPNGIVEWSNQPYTRLLNGRFTQRAQNNNVSLPMLSYGGVQHSDPKTFCETIIWRNSTLGKRQTKCPDDKAIYKEFITYLNHPTKLFLGLLGKAMGQKA